MAFTPENPETVVKILADPAALAAEGARSFVKLAREAIDRRGRFSVALSGGSTPRAMHHLLAAPPLRDRVSWSKVHIFFGDERFVPPDHPESTLRMARETLLDHLPIPSSNVYPMPTVGLPAGDAAELYAATLVEFFAAEIPRFDLIFLGMGPDGHTASLFPGHPEVTSPSGRLVAVVTGSPKPPPTRLTLTYKSINAAANVIFLVAGAGKARAVGEIMDGSASPQQRPAAGVQPPAGNLLWLLDQAAAGDLSD